MANALTICRIVLSLVLLVPPALSPAFFVIYTAAGVTDMIDGFIARKTGTESVLGARLDSVADLVFAVVCLTKTLPAITVPAWLWVWVALIVVVKTVNVNESLVRKLAHPPLVRRTSAWTASRVCCKSSYPRAATTRHLELTARRHAPTLAWCTSRARHG